MAAGFDGSITIDTSINPKGFNAGIKAMMGAVKGLGAVLGIALGIGALVAFGKTAVDTASRMSASMVGLQSVVEGTGGSFASAQKFINGYIEDGLIPAMNAMTAYKNLAMRGYDVTQIEQTMIALKDSAAFGRQASLTMGQAVESATEGLKNENSILVDNAGVTKNVSMMWKDYAASIGVSVGQLTKAQKIIAEVNGIQQETRFQMGDAAKYSETYAGKVAMLSQVFVNLKVAIGNSIIPLLAQMIPYIITAAKWFTVLFNTISQYIQAFFGYDPSANMAAYEKATVGAAVATGTLADNTEKAGKKAQGALASFDQLNVLQRPEEGGGAGAVSAGVGPSMGAPDMGEFDGAMSDQFDKIEAQVKDFKALFADLWTNFTIIAKWGWQWVIDNVWTPLSTWFNDNVIQPLWKSLQWLWEVIRTSAIALWEGGLRNVFNSFIQFFRDIFVNQFKAAWDMAVNIVGDVILMFSGMLDGMLINIGGWIQLITGILTGDWKKAWDGMQNIVKGALKATVSYLYGTANIIIDILNGIIGSSAAGLNALFTQLNKVSIDIPSILGSPAFKFGINLSPVVVGKISKLSIPKLATGAVIPPNSQFAAILGDQKSGRNLEAPEGLIRQIIQEEMGNQNVTVNFTGTMGALVRAMKPEIDRENIRIGNSLIVGAR